MSVIPEILPINPPLVMTMSPFSSEAMRQYISELDEIFLPSANITQTREYYRFGLADASIAEIARSQKARVITVDSELFGYLSTTGLNVVNLRHQRTPRRPR